MKVSIENEGEVIWYRDGEKQEGMHSLSYLKDGTQQKIIAALEEALFQAKGQCLSWYNADGVTNSSLPTT